MSESADHGANSCPVINPDDLTRLEQLRESMALLADRFETAQRESMQIAKKINESIQRARDINRPLALVFAEKKDPQSRIVKTLHSTLGNIWPRTVTAKELAELTKYSESTVRTFLPRMEREGLIGRDCGQITYFEHGQ